ncbi:MAG: hypothetical protein ABI591_26605 [Kofleriaceae bacterium]
MKHLIGMIVVVASCAKAQNGTPDGGGGGPTDSGPAPDASCGDHCDHDGDGVVDGSDQCPDTATGAMVNHVGCADSQLTSTLEPLFPPYGLTWTSGGDLGRAGGLTWTYVNIDRKDLFHIDWIVCDDPATPCGLSLDGPIDVPAENWLFSSIDSDPANGKLVYSNATHILLADATTPALVGRLTITIVDGSDVPIHFADVTALGVTTARSGTYGAEITGTAFKVVALVEVQDVSMTWTPYMDYYDAASTPVAGGGTATSFGGSFYDK